jgi:hypothetical protein
VWILDNQNKVSKEYMTIHATAKLRMSEEEKISLGSNK